MIKYLSNSIVYYWYFRFYTYKRILNQQVKKMRKYTSNTNYWEYSVPKTPQSWFIGRPKELEIKNKISRNIIRS